MEPVREFHEQLPSTQARALELARAGAPAGTRVVARRQSSGRGRADHSWLSPPGGLYLSVLVPIAEGEPALLPLAVGARLADEIERQWAVRCALKWPNDLLIESPDGRARKLSGILVDAIAPAPVVPLAVVGIGVNVVAPRGGFPPGLPTPPVALSELVHPCPSLEEVEAVAVASAVGAAGELARPDAPARVLARCRSRLYGVGRRAVVDGSIVGTISSLAEDGSLVLDVDGARVPVRAGDLSVEAA